MQCPTNPPKTDLKPTTVVWNDPNRQFTPWWISQMQKPTRKKKRRK